MGRTNLQLIYLKYTLCSVDPSPSPRIRSVPEAPATRTTLVEEEASVATVVELEASEDMAVEPLEASAVEPSEASEVEQHKTALVPPVIRTTVVEVASEGSVDLSKTALEDNVTRTTERNSKAGTRRLLLSGSLTYDINILTKHA